MSAISAKLRHHRKRLSRGFAPVVIVLCGAASPAAAQGLFPGPDSAIVLLRSSLPQDKALGAFLFRLEPALPAAVPLLIGTLDDFRKVVIQLRTSSGWLASVMYLYFQQGQQTSPAEEAYLALRRGGDVVREALAAALQDSKPDVQFNARNLLALLGDARAIPALRASLGSPAIPASRQTVALLKGLPDSLALPVLREGLRTAPASARLDVAEYLASRGDSSAIPVVLAELRNPDAELRARAVFRLADWPSHPEARPALASALGDPKPNVRAAAVSALARLGDPPAQAALVPALADRDNEVRRRAAAALHRLGHPRGTEEVLKDLGDKDRRIQIQAVEVLEQPGKDPRVVTALLPLLQDRKADYRGSIRTPAIRALGAAGVRAAVPGLLEIMKEPRVTWRGDPELAAAALWRIGDPAAAAAIRALFRAADSGRAKAQASRPTVAEPDAVTVLAGIVDGLGGDYAEHAITTLSWTTDPRGREVLVSLVEGKRSPRPAMPLRLKALTTLIELGDQAPHGAIDLIVEGLKAQSFPVRRAAAEAAELLPDRRLVAPLAAGLSDRDPAVRSDASVALLRVVIALCGDRFMQWQECVGP